MWLLKSMMHHASLHVMLSYFVCLNVWKILANQLSLLLTHRCCRLHIRDVTYITTPSPPPCYTLVICKTERHSTCDWSATTLKTVCGRIQSYLCHGLLCRPHPGARALRTAHSDSTKRSPRQGRSYGAATGSKIRGGGGAAKWIF
jgi:hypothetical protein